LLKQVVRHDFSDHTHLIQYDYKSNCKHSFFSKNPTNGLHILQ
jgi:hypothetical protein